jgi:hypothetical protein
MPWINFISLVPTLISWLSNNSECSLIRRFLRVLCLYTSWLKQSNQLMQAIRSMRCAIGRIFYMKSWHQMTAMTKWKAGMTTAATYCNLWSVMCLFYTVWHGFLYTVLLTWFCSQHDKYSRIFSHNFLPRIVWTLHTKNAEYRAKRDNISAQKKIEKKKKKKRGEGGEEEAIVDYTINCSQLAG